MKTFNMKNSLKSFVCLSALMLPQAVLAQNAETRPTETVVVTGSRVRVAAPVGSAMVALSRDTIVNSTGVTIDKVIRELPSVLDIGISENSRAQSGGSGNIVYSNSINIRGIGPYSTLILVDGHRVTSNTRSFDPSVMPTLGVERIEVIADGASAIYGSDAVAGVVNLVPRRTLDGIEASARYGQSEDAAYDELQYGVAWGKVWDRGQAMIAYEHVDRSNLNGSDRDFFRSNQTAFGGNDYSVTRCNPGTITLAGVTYAIPQAGLTAANVGSLTAATSNKCDDLIGQDLFPKQTYNSVNGTFTLEINDMITFVADAFHSRREFQRLPAYFSRTISVPTTNAFYVDINGAAANTAYNIDYNFYKDLPRNMSFGHAESWQFTPSLKFKLPNDWQFEALWGGGYTDDDSVSLLGLNTAALTTALASNNTATAFDPYGLGRTNTAVLAGLTNQISINPTRGTFTGGELRLNGAAFKMPGGMAQTAFGLERQNIMVEAGSATGNPGALLTLTKRYRTVESAYAEILLPFVGEGNAMPFIQKLDLDLAYRYDKYNDVGETSNPKIGINWTVSDDLKIHASYGTSFRAPNILQIYGNTNNFFVQNYQNPLGGAPVVGVALSGGNLDLKPETAETWSIGADWTPIDNLKLTATYFDITYEAQIASLLSDLTLLKSEALYAGTGVILRDAAAQARINELIGQGITIRAGGTPLPSTVNLFVDGRSRNLGVSLTRGIDFTANYRIDTDNIGRFDLSVNGTYLTKFAYGVSPTAPLIDNLNFIFQPQELKMRYGVSWRDDGYSASLKALYLGSYTNNLIAVPQKVDSMTVVDFNASVDLDKVMPNLLGADGLTLGFEVRNIFDQAPPYVNTIPTTNGSGGYDATMANPIGRLFGVSLRARW